MSPAAAMISVTLGKSDMAGAVILVRPDVLRVPVAHHMITRQSLAVHLANRKIAKLCVWPTTALTGFVRPAPGTNDDDPTEIGANVTRHRSPAPLCAAC